ncbi:MAG: 30S ribosomal protein S9 [Candidatus Yanofskybacteria bacterium CG10_big_fil_rev_8_21_14_0_10_46_23]|uniref:Small ribosomal subunit protein uS9 n=1 Tax=Candidatus Yanofskybacteria bacterium CG10_big_fil_rev_8_21_14_0_10_46_23 TaxID=1975098 RepID=A0A2H0R4Q6_9BACT|nr:MAG: 30S ribosomal protein S9 [Candidatus Yanofskybacteria bacterium CG10_big_fil_rev_8_21_14_0_10_46_23]
MAEEKTKTKKEKGATPEVDEQYYEAVGRRKESVARVRIITQKVTDAQKEGQAQITINGKPHTEYIPQAELQQIVESPLQRLKSIDRFKAIIKVSGGGIRGQADAIRHGISRALVKFDDNFGKKMRRAGFLTRDSRIKERKKYGLKKARRAPQWSKR